MVMLRIFKKYYDVGGDIQPNTYTEIHRRKICAEAAGAGKATFTFGNSVSSFQDFKCLTRVWQGVENEMCESILEKVQVQTCVEICKRQRCAEAAGAEKTA